MHKIWLKCIKALLVFLTAFVSGYATYFIVRGLFARVRWLLDYELSVSEHGKKEGQGAYTFKSGHIDKGLYKNNRFLGEAEN